ncbi:DUF3800 domain-containing protein [Sphingomonas trueperi]|uniref:DUF3800 domain-containing protein n=1 Tax=Sphingomonas trueperi TaxID=53317 RepID=UPI0033922215
MPAFSDYIVFADESGDHGLQSIDPQFPVFALVFCIFEKSAYAENVEPAFRRLKFKYFGHDAAILHEREIRKQEPPFAFFKKRFRSPSSVHGRCQRGDGGCSISRILRGDRQV